MLQGVRAGVNEFLIYVIAPNASSEVKIKYGVRAFSSVAQRGGRVKQTGKDSGRQSRASKDIDALPTERSEN